MSPAQAGVQFGTWDWTPACAGEHLSGTGWVWSVL